MIQDTSSQDVILTQPGHRRIWLKLTIISLVIVALSFTAYPTISNWSSTDRTVKNFSRSN